MSEPCAKTFDSLSGYSSRLAPVVNEIQTSGYRQLMQASNEKSFSKKMHVSRKCLDAIAADTRGIGRYSTISICRNDTLNPDRRRSRTVRRRFIFEKNGKALESFRPSHFAITA